MYGVTMVVCALIVTLFGPVLVLHVTQSQAATVTLSHLL